MRACVCVAGLMALALVLDQGTPVAGQDKAKSATFQADGPGPKHKRLDVLVGSWDVTVTFQLGGKQNEGKASCEAKWILDGRVVQQEYKSKLMGQPYTVLQLVGYDNLKKKSFEIMLQNLHTGVLHTEGTFSEDDKVITNYGESLDPMSGKTYKLKTVTTFRDSDHFTLEWFKVGAAAKEERTVSMSHTRRQI